MESPWKLLPKGFQINIHNQNTSSSYFIKFSIDSESDAHMCNNKDLFTYFKYYKSITFILLEDSHNTTCLGVVIIEIILSNGNRINIHHVLYVPDIQM